MDVSPIGLHGRRRLIGLSRNDSVELRFDGQNETTEAWSELTTTRFGSVTRTFSGLGSSRSTSIAWRRLRAGRKCGTSKVARLATICTLLFGCGVFAPLVASEPERTLPPFLDTVQKRTFEWFWDETDPATGLTAARAPSRPFSSIAGIGFALTAYGIGAERGWVTREQAKERTLATLRFMWKAPQGPDSMDVTGHRGFFYHFLDLKTGYRYRQTELSSIDTTLLLGGVLFAQVYFEGEDPQEREIRDLAESIYQRVDWNFFLHDPPTVTMGWYPEQGYGRGRWRGYDESIILHVLALGSPTHPIKKETYDAFVSTYHWADFHGQEHVNFPPHFGHHYSHIWIDFRGIQDDFMREKGIDYFENTRRATIAQRAYAIENPAGWKAYGPELWGLSASTGPGRITHTIDRRERNFFGYSARGAAAPRIIDDGTIAPAAAAGSIPFAPEIAIPAVRAMLDRYGNHIFGRYGFLDAFNATLVEKGEFNLQHGEIVPGVCWVATDYLCTNQGPIVTMIENHRSRMIWERMQRSPHLVRGLRRAGFRGGWLDGRGP